MITIFVAARHWIVVELIESVVFVCLVPYNDLSYVTSAAIRVRIVCALRFISYNFNGIP